MIIDFHTHAFPDSVATNAIPSLEKKGGVRANTKGTVSSLLTSMDLAGINTSVICSIATRPDQFNNILNWSKKIESDRIIPLPSIHPADPDPASKIETLAKEGFPGIKMHPYYQDFYMTDERMAPIYRTLSENNMFVVMHTGFDIGFPRDERATPKHIMEIHENYPDLKLVTTHLGGWDMWDGVKETIIGKKIYIEISFSLHFLTADKAKFMLENHDPDYLVFGTDSPWEDQNRAVERVQNLGLKPFLYNRLMYKNGANLLKATGYSLKGNFDCR